LQGFTLDDAAPVAWSLTSAAIAAASALVPAGVTLALIVRRDDARRARAAILGAAGFGVVVGVVVHVLLRVISASLGLEIRGTPDDLVVLAFGFLFAGPLEQAALAGATLPALRSAHNDTPSAALRLVLATSLGLIVAKATILGASQPPSALLAVRVWTIGVGEVSLAAMWGYVLAVTRRRTLGGSGFGAAWIAAVVFGAALDHLVFMRGDGALVAAIPLATFTASVATFVGRSVSRTPSKPVPRERRSRYLRAPPPSLTALREALRRSERPVLLGWVVFGALVTVGVVTSSFAAAVFFGHRLGIDFAAVDRGRSGVDTAAPLVLLGVGLLGGFPIAGFLVARASRSATVMEPALAAGIAIIAFAVLLGAAAPVALVFAIAGAPIAFALACIGAWTGLRPS
jgi:hypothetical protein